MIAQSQRQKTTQRAFAQTTMQDVFASKKPLNIDHKTPITLPNTRCCLKKMSLADKIKMMIYFKSCLIEILCLKNQILTFFYVCALPYILACDNISEEERICREEEHICAQLHYDSFCPEERYNSGDRTLQNTKPRPRSGNVIV